jgi:tRNA modification GTPase
MRHGDLVSCSGEYVDEVLAVYMPSGRSYTGLDQIEIFCHGGRRVVQIVLEQVIASGARPAEPGEFTKLAFLNGRIDLAEAEAVAEVIAASTEASLQAGRDHMTGLYSQYVSRLRTDLLAALADLEASIDFSEDDVAQIDTQAFANRLQVIHIAIQQLAATYRGGRIVREGFRVAICGRPNAGKSSRFNLLLEHERALVDPEPGTTRDYLSEWIDLGGFAVNLVDTAGLRDSAGRVEQQGQVKAQQVIERADLILWVADMSEPNWVERARTDLLSLGDPSKLIIGNKLDLVAERWTELSTEVRAVSCVTREGIGEVQSAILALINDIVPDLTSGQVVTSARHKRCLDRAEEGISRTVAALDAGESADILAFELRQAADQLGEITGQVYTEEILSEIFSRFCIGK